jgi:hypothetical protein
LDHHGADLPRHAIRWDFPKQIGFTDECDERFWLPLARADFWATLDWTCQGKELLAIAEEIYHRDNICIMTAANTPEAAQGKLMWIRRCLPKYRRRFFIGPPKEMAAGPGKVLCDDHDQNTAKFSAAGGLSVLLPRPWNERREETVDGYRFDLQRVGDELALAATRILYPPR